MNNVTTVAIFIPEKGTEVIVHIVKYSKYYKSEIMIIFGVQKQPTDLSRHLLSSLVMLHQICKVNSLTSCLFQSSMSSL